VRVGREEDDLALGHTPSAVLKLRHVSSRFFIFTIIIIFSPAPVIYIYIYKTAKKRR